MLKSAVDDGSEDFRFKEKISETGAMNGDVSSLDVLLGSGPVRSVGRFGSGLGLVLLLVVEKIVVGNIGHCDEKVVSQVLLKMRKKFISKSNGSKLCFDN